MTQSMVCSECSCFRWRKTALTPVPLVQIDWIDSQYFGHPVNLFYHAGMPITDMIKNYDLM